MQLCHASHEGVVPISNFARRVGRSSLVLTVQPLMVSREWGGEGFAVEMHLQVAAHSSIWLVGANAEKIFTENEIEFFFFLLVFASLSLKKQLIISCCEFRNLVKEVAQ